MNRRRIIAGLLAAALLAVPSIATANDSSMGGAGGAVTPIGSSNIRMDAETVQVLLFGDFAEYRVDFRFENSGPPQLIKLGFPFPLPFEGEENATPAAAFRAWKGETPLVVTYQEVTAKSGARIAYYLHEAEFPTGTTMIRVSYYARHDSTAGSPPDGVAPSGRFAGAPFSYWGFYPYTVSTGAGWAGTIGKSVIRYYVTGDALAWGFEPAIAAQAEMLSGNSEAPAGSAETLKAYTRRADNVYEWVFTDFEPTPDAEGRSAYDIELAYYVPAGDSEVALPWMPVKDVKASSELKLDGFEYLAFNAVDGNPSTAWAEAVKGSGVGQSLTVTFPATRAVREIRVLPGHAKTETLFRKYNRPMTLDIEFSDGTKTSLSLADEPALQRFVVSADAEWAKVTIRDVYRGTTRDETYLSEIEFGQDTSDVHMLPFETVLAGGLSEPSTQTTEQPQPDGNGEDRTPGALPEWLRNPGWPLISGCIGCAVLLGLVIGGTLVVVLRRRGPIPPA
ncbi:MAG: hypothetical protein Q7W16_08105 [Coriobacteriia bacterium]|nr:hypothetical protein [Coriobacteriia bacterium]